MISETYNMDCVQGMKEYPNKYFDLAIVAPPYGINASEMTSFDVVLRKANIRYKVFLGADNIRIHPTQKPVKLYEWLLINYANEGDKILDTHLGSGSSRIASYNLKFDFVGFELDKEYFEAQEKRYKTAISQQVLF